MAEFFESYAIWAIWIVFGLFFLIFLVMAPCHAVLLLPFVALPLFWLLPLGYALPIYVVIVLISAFLYWLIRRAMRKPLATNVSCSNFMPQFLQNITDSRRQDSSAYHIYRQVVQ